MRYADKNEKDRKRTGAGYTPPSFSDDGRAYRDSRGNERTRRPPEVNYSKRPGQTRNSGYKPNTRGGESPVRAKPGAPRASGPPRPAARRSSETASKTIRKKTQNKRRMSRLYLFAAVITVIAAVVLALTAFFNVKEIEVRGNSRYSAEDIIRHSGISIGDNLLLMDKFASAESIKKNMLYIGEIEIRRSFPDKIIINVTEINVAAAFDAGGGYYWLCDDYGTLLELSVYLPEKTAVVYGTTLTDSAPGKSFTTADSRKQQPLEELFEALRENGLFGSVVSIDIEVIYDIKLNYMDRYMVTLGKSGDFSEACIKLTMLITQLEAEGSMTGSIYFQDDGIHFIGQEQ